VNVDAHRAKAEAIERSLGRLTPADHEAVVEGCMLAGTHWLNLLLHSNGLSVAEQDAMHAEFMSLGERRKAMLVVPAAIEAMDRIEALRTTHVRGDLPDGEGAARQAIACLRVLREMADARRPSPLDQGRQA
jgi:hypothetical protein